MPCREPPSALKSSTDGLSGCCGCPPRPTWQARRSLTFASVLPVTTTLQPKKRKASAHHRTSLIRYQAAPTLYWLESCFRIRYTVVWTVTVTNDRMSTHEIIFQIFFFSFLRYFPSVSCIVHSAATASPKTSAIWKSAQCPRLDLHNQPFVASKNVADAYVRANLSGGGAGCWSAWRCR